MTMQQRSLFLLTLISLPLTTNTLGFPEDKKIYEYALYGVSFISVSASIYQWVTKKSVEKNFEAYKKKFKNQAFIQERYDEALTILAHYKEYSDVFVQPGLPEEQAQRICQNLMHHYAKNPSQLAHFKKEVHDQLDSLLQKSKEIDQKFVQWQESKKKTMLIVQGPLLKKAYSQCIETLESLRTHIPYLESTLFLQNYGPFLKDEREFSKHLTHPDQLPCLIAQLVRSKTRIGERYPYRTYTKTLEVHHEYAVVLEHELNNHTYYPFQDEILISIKTISATLDGLKKQLKSSKEFEAECAHFDAEVLAVAHEKEAKNLKKQLSTMSHEIDSLKGQTPTA